MTTRPFNPPRAADKRTNEPDNDVDHCSAYSPECDGDIEELRRRLAMARAVAMDLSAWIERKHRTDECPDAETE